MRVIDLTGKRFGRLVVTARSAAHRGGEAWWEAVCDCGNRRAVGGYRLRSGATTSCGCYKRELSRQKMLALHVGQRGAARSGVEIGYAGAHVRRKRLVGPAALFSCVDCGGSGQDWSYTHDCPSEREEVQERRHRATVTIAYCPCADARHYVARCKSCHVRHDRRRAA